MKYNKSKIMKQAHEIKKSGLCRTWSESLKRSWFYAKQERKAAEAKAARQAMKVENIFTKTATFEGAEFRFWANYGKRRIYISGGINNRWNGSYIDLTNNQIFTRRSECRECAERFLESYTIAC